MVPPAPTCLGAVPPQACTGRHSSSSEVALRCSVAIKVLRSLDSRPVVFNCSLWLLHHGCWQWLRTYSSTQGHQDRNIHSLWKWLDSKGKCASVTATTSQYMLHHVAIRKWMSLSLAQGGMTKDSKQSGTAQYQSMYIPKTCLNQRGIIEPPQTSCDLCFNVDAAEHVWTFCDVTLTSINNVRSRLGASPFLSALPPSPQRMVQWCTIKGNQAGATDIYNRLLRAISFMRQHRHAFSYDSYASTVGTCCLLRQFERHRATLEVAPSIPRATAAWKRTSSSSSSWDAASSACTVGISWATRPRSDNLKHKIRRKAWR